MKKWLLLAALLSVAHLGFAQAKAVKHFYNQYKNHTGVEEVKLQGWLLKLAATFSEEDEATKHWLKKISSLRMLTMEEGNLVTPQAYSELVRSLHEEAFEDLIMVRQEGQHVQFLIRENDHKITDVLLLINDTDDFTLLSLEGWFNFSDLNDIEIDIAGSEHFKKLPENRKDIRRME